MHEKAATVIHMSGGMGSWCWRWGGRNGLGRHWVLEEQQQGGPEDEDQDSGMHAWEYIVRSGIGGTREYSAKDMLWLRGA